MTDTRVEHILINKHVRQHNRECRNLSIVWFEFISFGAGSTYDDVYNEGGPGAPGRVYAGGITIPVIYVSENEDEFHPKDEGRQVLQTLRLTFLFLDLKRVGLTAPAEYQRHLNDVIWYDDKYYKVSAYTVWGVLPDEVVVGVQGYEIYPDQEFMFDADQPPAPLNTTLPWPPTLPPVMV